VISSSSLAFHRRALEFEQAERAYLSKFDQIMSLKERIAMSYQTPMDSTTFLLYPIVFACLILRDNTECAVKLRRSSSSGTLDTSDEDGIVWFLL